MSSLFEHWRTSARMWGMLAAVQVLAGTLSGADTFPPTSPAGLSAVAADCAQVNLKWQASSDEAGGSGLKAYRIYRQDGSKLTAIYIAGARTTFSDTNLLRSGAALSYYVAAVDVAGNESTPSGLVSVSTPPCPLASGEAVIDDASMEPMGKSMASYGSRSVVLYTKLNSKLTLDTWIAVIDSDTNQTSRFMLHGPPAYRQIESDYVLTSATDLWTLSFNPFGGGNLLVSQYKLNGSPAPSSATLVTAQAFGDSVSYGKGLIRLRSGGLVAAWNQDRTIKPNAAADMGFAYRSPAGVWSSTFPLENPTVHGGNNALTQIALAQHPQDDSIWAFAKRDTFDSIAAVHFTEAGGALTLDWLKPDFISSTTDGQNGPQGEFPYLTAVPDSSGARILLAYQNNDEQMVYVDPLLNDLNMIFLKSAYASIAQISATGGKSFLRFPYPFERGVQFQLSASSNGSLWLTYQPIQSSSLTWNQVYSSYYSNGTWSAPALTGWNFTNYNVASAQRDPGFLVGRLDDNVVAFHTPDQKVHAFRLPGGTASAADTEAPATAITSPAAGTGVSGVVTISATASDNVGVSRVEFWIDNLLQGNSTAAPYSYRWDTSAASAGTHNLQTVAYDAAGNTGRSTIVTVSKAAAADTTAPSTSITSPAAGSTVTGVVTVSATATDSVGVARVDLLVDGTVLGSKTAAPYTFSWDTSAISAGTHTLQSVAYDAAGNVGRSAAISVTKPSATDTLAPAVSIVRPGNGSAVPRNTTVTVETNASDNISVSGVEMYVGTALLCRSTSAPYQCAWKVPAKRAGTYTIKAVAIDGSGNSSSAMATVTAP